MKAWIEPRLIGAAMLALTIATGGCAFDSDLAARDVGVIELPLLTSGESGRPYRLLCEFHVRHLDRPTEYERWWSGSSDRQALREEVPVGPYRITLLANWQLQRRSDQGRWERISARLVNDRQQRAQVQRGRTTHVSFDFDANGDRIRFWSGLSIGFRVFDDDAGVDEDAGI